MKTQRKCAICAYKLFIYEVSKVAFVYNQKLYINIYIHKYMSSHLKRMCNYVYKQLSKVTLIFVYFMIYCIFLFIFYLYKIKGKHFGQHSAS